MQAVSTLLLLDRLGLVPTETKLWIVWGRGMVLRIDGCSRIGYTGTTLSKWVTRHVLSVDIDCKPSRERSARLVS